jgi:hypothetical protein
MRPGLVLTQDLDGGLIRPTVAVRPRSMGVASGEEMMGFSLSLTQRNGTTHQSTSTVTAALKLHLPLDELRASTHKDCGRGNSLNVLLGSG